jgi:DNA-directed RNA polymerase I, II, and III subunit RPABC2
MSGLIKETKEPEIDDEYISDNGDESVDDNESDANSIVSSDDENEDEDLGAGNSDDDEGPDIYSGKISGIPPTQGDASLKYTSGDDTDDDNDENYLQKFDDDMNKNFLVDFHPECVNHNDDEIQALTTVVRDANNNIIDDLHKTIPYLTKYEKTRIIGQRTKQINSGSKTFVNVPENVIDGYLVALMELEQKRIPFIIRRPIPNGGSEYWNLRDLELVGY